MRVWPQAKVKGGLRRRLRAAGNLGNGGPQPSKDRRTGAGSAETKGDPVRRGTTDDASQQRRDPPKVLIAEQCPRTRNREPNERVNGHDRPQSLDSIDCGAAHDSTWTVWHDLERRGGNALLHFSPNCLLEPRSELDLEPITLDTGQARPNSTRRGSSIPK